MPAPKINKADESAINEFGFEFGEVPAKAETRRSKHDERWSAARAMLMKNPGKSLKVFVSKTASNAYNTAKPINNADHRMFKDNDPQVWHAEAVRDATDENPNQHSVWLTYKPID